MDLKTHSKVDFPSPLSVRTGDQYTLTPWDGPGDLSKATYAVALYVAPDLEKLAGEFPVSSVSWPFGVAVAGLTLTGWGWIPVDQAMKDMVGAALLEMDAKPYQWFRLTIEYVLPVWRSPYLKCPICHETWEWDDFPILNQEGDQKSLVTPLCPNRCTGPDDLAVELIRK